jgi:hypothetical protein
MLAEKFFLLLETIRSNTYSDGAPRVVRAGLVCLNKISASISGASAGVRPPSGVAAG